MQTLSLIVKEARHRWMTFSLSILAVTAATAVCVGFQLLWKASARETRRVTRDLGFNLRLIPRETDLSQYLSEGYARPTMPESLLARLQVNDRLNYNHLVATLHQPIEVQGQQAILTGLAPEYCPPGQKKPPMSPLMQRGTAQVGHHLSNALNLDRGDTLTVKGVGLEVVRVMPEAGTRDDLRIVTSLKDAQTILDLPGRINEIQAIDCLCMTASENPLGILREDIESQLPEAKVVLDSIKADARAKQRQMIENYAALAMPMVLAVAAILVSVLTMANVRARTSEIGIMRALGFGSTTVAGLFLGKALWFGLLGGVLGYLVGTALALVYGPSLFPVTAKAIRPDRNLLYWALALAPLFAMVATLVPTMIAVRKDPADTLRQE